MFFTKSDLMDDLSSEEFDTAVVALLNARIIEKIDSEDEPMYQLTGLAYKIHQHLDSDPDIRN